jgi:uncharacterized membrane protein YeaQ/YmgE (transglycosylase-associated protein family)
LKGDERMEPDKIRAAIAALIILGFLAVLAAFFFMPLKGDPGLFNVLIGILGGSFTSVVSFYFASTSGSKAKDETIGAIAASVTKTNGSLPEAPTITRSRPPASVA